MKINNFEIKLSNRTRAMIAEARLATREWWNDLLHNPVTKFAGLVAAVAVAVFMLLPWLTD
jgi:hypothetical protein